MKAVVPFKVVPGHGISALLSNLQLWAKAALLNEILDSGETVRGGVLDGSLGCAYAVKYILQGYFSGCGSRYITRLNI